MKTASLMYFLTADLVAPLYAQNEAGRLTVKQSLGPDRLSGTLATPCSGILSLEYRPEAQRWVKLPGGVWLGVDKAERPEPSALQRAEIRTGHLVKLGDGQCWEIPVARLATGGSGLPRRRVLAADGTRTWEVDAAYAGLTDAAARVWMALRGQSVSMADEEVDRACGAALAVNYRLGLVEALVLGLLTDTAIRGILEALVDMPTVRQILDVEKKTAGTSAG
jgi:hypothetical protein